MSDNDHRAAVARHQATARDNLIRTDGITTTTESMLQTQVLSAIHERLFAIAHAILDLSDTIKEQS
jgi:hypothetical protein